MLMDMDFKLFSVFAQFAILLIDSTWAGSTQQNYGCYWKGEPDVNVPGGDLADASGLADCRSKCSVNVYCSKFGFDFDPSTNKCWFSKSSQKQSAPGVTHYTNNCPEPVLATTPAMSCGWFQTPSSSSQGGVERPALNVTLCQKLCEGISGCVSIDWTNTNPQYKQCYTHNDHNTVNTGGTPGTDHYDYLCGKAGKNAAALGVLLAALMLVLFT